MDIARQGACFSACEYIIENFTQQLPRFHTKGSVDSGRYTSIDRQGNTQEFSLLSLSIGIVSTEVHHITSAAEVSSIASDLKKRAKEIPGSSIIRDRRVKSWFEKNSQDKPPGRLGLVVG